jgi:hypothetical protein
MALAVAFAGTAILAVSDQPAVNRSAEISPQNVDRIIRILDKNDPRTLKPGSVQTIAITQQDFDLAANYLAHRYANASSRIALAKGTIHLETTFELPVNPFGSYVNLNATLKENGGLPRFERLQIGWLPFPGVIADWLLSRAIALYLGDEGYRSALEAIKQVKVSDNGLTLTYEWHASLPDRLRKALLPKDGQNRIHIYHARLTEISRTLGPKNVSLLELLIPLFILAETRSRDGDPVEENQAVLLVLTLYVNEKGLTRFIPAAKDWPAPSKHHVTLNDRHDFAQHFTVSAAIAANAGGIVSSAMGLYKEIADSRDGSGFSFNDIAADRAGTRFGEVAVGSARSARKLQQQLSVGVKERDLMPETGDLPEYLSEAEFRRRFGGLDGPEYNKIMAEIERRISNLALYDPLF